MGYHPTLHLICNWLDGLPAFPTSFHDPNAEIPCNMLPAYAKVRHPTPEEVRAAIPPWGLPSSTFMLMFSMAPDTLRICGEERSRLQEALWPYVRQQDR